MKKFNRASKVLGAGAAVAAVVGGTTMSAQAATSFTPTGSTVTFVGSGVQFKDIEVDQTLTCSQFDLTGSAVNSGVSRAYGENAGVLDALNSSGCSNNLAGPTQVTPSGDWGVTVTGDATGTVWPARLTNVTANVVANNCKFTVSGNVDGTFDTATQTFTPKGVNVASGLTVSDIPDPDSTSTQALCVTLDILEGDAVGVGGSWTNSGPDLAVSNP